MQDEGLGAAGNAPWLVAAMSLLCLSQARHIGCAPDGGVDALPLGLVVGSLIVANLATWRLQRAARALARRTGLAG